MSHRHSKATPAPGLADPSTTSAPARPLDATTDARLPYEAPKIVKRRSIVQATLFSVMTTSAMAMTGN